MSIGSFGCLLLCLLDHMIEFEFSFLSFCLFCLFCLTLHKMMLAIGAFLVACSAPSLFLALSLTRPVFAHRVTLARPCAAVLRRSWLPKPLCLFPNHPLNMAHPSHTCNAGIEYLQIYFVKEFNSLFTLAHTRPTLHQSQLLHLGCNASCIL